MLLEWCSYLIVPYNFWQAYISWYTVPSFIETCEHGNHIVLLCTTLYQIRRHDKTRHYIKSNDTTLHQIKRHDITRHYIKSDDTTKHDIISNQTTRQNTTLHQIRRHDITRHYIKSDDTTNHDIISNQTTRHNMSLYRIESNDTTQHQALWCTLIHETWSKKSDNSNRNTYVLPHRLFLGMFHNVGN